jgi:hypothetical protein
VTIGTSGGTSGFEGRRNPEPPIGGPIERGPGGDEEVCLGDEHVSGVESLCVGESQ